MVLSPKERKRIRDEIRARYEKIKGMEFADEVLRFLDDAEELEKMIRKGKGVEPGGVYE